MDWLQGMAGRDALLVGIGTLLAFFGWDFFQLTRLAVGGILGGIAGWLIYRNLGMPSGLAAMGFEPASWMVILIFICALVGLFILRAIRTLSSFIFGVLLGFLIGKALFGRGFLEGPLGGWWGLYPREAILAGIAGGVLNLVSEKVGVILMTSFLGSCFVGVVFTWKYFTWLMFGVSAMVQWWVQADRPIRLPFQRERKQP